MTRLKRVLLASVGIVLLSSIALFTFLWWGFAGSHTPSNIVDFHPTNFQETADTNFFYSISNELKNSSQLTPKAPTLLRGHIENFLVSPDRKSIAVVANNFLAVVDENGFVRQIAPVDSIYREHPPIGKRFFRDRDFQWTRDSRSLYLIGDEFYNSQGSQLFSAKGELWKYDLQSGVLQLVLKPFPAYSYFFGGISGIYFSVPTASGDLLLKYFDGKDSVDINSPDTFNISHDELGSGIGESPFYSFDIMDYRDTVLPSKGAGLRSDTKDNLQKLVIANRPYLTFTQGEGMKGAYYCTEMLRSVFLPGDRYFLLNASYCGNYNGQLLIDTVSGQYKTLPLDTVVYTTSTTETYTGYRITVGGIVAR